MHNQSADTRPSPVAATNTHVARWAEDENLVKVYGFGPRVVDGISLAFRRGRFTAIMGASGSGKSMLMNGLAGLDSPTTGRIFVGGMNITGLPETGHELLGYLASYVRNLNQTAVMITHEPTAVAHAGRSLLLADGEVAALTAPRPVTEPAASGGPGRAGIILTLALLTIGALLFDFGIASSSLLLTAMPAAAVSTVGVPLLTRSFLPPLLRLAGRIGGMAGGRGRLAAATAVRSPGRAAAPSAALVVGVGLIVLPQVSPAALLASIDRATADRYPIDAS